MSILVKIIDVHLSLICYVRGDKLLRTKVSLPLYNKVYTGRLSFERALENALEFKPDEIKIIIVTEPA